MNIFCCERVIHMITSAFHSTDKLQLLDRAYFKPLKSAYSACADSWMLANPGTSISVYAIAAICRQTLLRSATAENVVQGSFRTCGLCPLDSNIFTDDDFTGSLVTEEEQPAKSTSSESHPHNPSVSSVYENRLLQNPSDQSYTKDCCSKESPCHPTTLFSISTDHSRHNDPSDNSAKPALYIQTLLYTRSIIATKCSVTTIDSWNLWHLLSYFKTFG